MDFTRDIRGSINDTATRKSLGRRVSFASHAQVRVFEKDANRGNASPSAGADHPGPSAQSETVVNDENDYPGASTLRRRSSLRRSIAFSENGEASMEMDSDLGSSPLPAGFLAQGSFLQDEEGLDDMSGVWDEQADMDLTTNLPATRPRKSSLGLSSLPQSGQDMSIDDQSRSEDMTQDSAGDISREQAEPTEFTVPLNKSLRKPEPPSAEWLALRAMTHAGADGPYEPPSSDMDGDGDELIAHERGAHLGEEDMDLTEAETRLRRMRESLGLMNVAQEDSFTNSEGSSIGGADQTINLTNVWRDSLGTDSSSAMDFTNVQGTSGENNADEAVNRALPPALAPQDPRAISEQHDSRAQPIPSRPPSQTPFLSSSLQDSPTPPAPPVFTKSGPVFSAPKHDPPSPSKPKSPASPRKTGTAAFALPVARPQPKKRAATPGVDDEDFEDEGSPVKKQAQQRPSPKPTSAMALTEGAATSSAARRSSVGGLRRPSGYFAQRRSLGPSGVLNIPQPISPRKKAAQGRTSEVGISGVDQSTVNFGRENLEPSTPLPHPQLPIDGPSKGTSLSSANDSSLPEPPSLFVMNNSVPSTESEAPATRPTVTFANVDAAEQWRNNVQPPSFTEEDEGVRINFHCTVRNRCLPCVSLPYLLSNFSI
jgi:kinetochore protein Spc7/SPC105